jgi:hypothetical protein
MLNLLASRTLKSEKRSCCPGFDGRDRAPRGPRPRAAGGTNGTTALDLAKIVPLLNGPVTTQRAIPTNIGFRVTDESADGATNFERNWPRESAKLAKAQAFCASCAFLRLSICFLSCGLLSRSSLLLFFIFGLLSGSIDAAPDTVSEKPSTLNPQPSTNHWAFQKLARPELPRVIAAERVRTPVDRFVLAKLETLNLSVSPDADRLTLLRRASLDLIGLPPSREEAEEFLADPNPDAYERLIDRLLASPHFGERWGRHWLDWAGYVDTLGGDNDAGIIKLGEGKWLYRDYVVRSFNGDKPYKRFLTEQLAGDELVDWRTAIHFTPEIKELLVATGFLRSSADDTDENELNTPDVRHAVLQRTGEVAANTLLGLTVNCAKCHDHKYEPISQQDYYRFMAIFSPAFNPQQWPQPKERALPDVSVKDKAEMEKHNRPFDQQIEELKKRQVELRRPYQERLLETKLARLPEQIRADAKVAVETPVEKRTEIQIYLANKFERELTVKPIEVTAALTETDKATLADLDGKIAGLNGKLQRWGMIQAVYDVGAPAPFHLLLRGNHETPGPQVQPGFLSTLCDSDSTAMVAPSDSAPSLGSTRPANTSGRRLVLAQWLTQPGTPAGGLAARVLVNRVWQQLFGRGIVETSDNFGRSGSGATHPELLDWLATEFLRQQGRVKPLLKLLMTSTVYRQAAASAGQPPRVDPGTIDPGNQFLWRQRLRRLESEVVRDSILSASGKLDLSIGGPPLPLETRPDGLVVIKEKGLTNSASQGRRSLYVLARRNYHLTMLNVFDQPVIATSCTLRNPSAVVSQSLTMLNDAFVLEQANGFADRVAQIAGNGLALEKRIELAFQIALTRPPSAEELRWSAELLERHTERYAAANLTREQAAQKALAGLCHTLLNTSEFIYVP